jgi:hypothetical protein
MVIRTINTQIIRQYPISRRVGEVGRIAHSPQDPLEHRGRRGSSLRLSLKEQTQQDELMSLHRLRCDIKLMNGDLDHDIAILNVVA